jgi:hypothetical protein
MRFLLGLIFVFVLAVPASLSPALAQKLPTVKEVGNIVFKEKARHRGILRQEGGRRGARRQGQESQEVEKGQSKGKGKGRGRGGGLPPSLQMQLERNGTLPPGLAKRELPPGLRKKLGAAPPGTERAVAGNDVVLLEKATGKILDVISGVLKGN